MYMLGFILLIIGAIASYLDKKTYKLIFKREPEENERLKVKISGFLVALVGVILIMIFFK